jgi:imidazolonepropionase
LIDRGIPVALASNFSRATAPTCNMQFVLFLACAQLRMRPAEAVTAATINAAYALRLGSRVGSIETGKLADIVTLNVGDYRELAYQFGINLVHTVIKGGAVVHEGSGVRWPAES